MSITFLTARLKNLLLVTDDSIRLLQDSGKAYRRIMNRHINKHKWKNMNRLRQMHTIKPKEYWRYLNTVTNNKSNTKNPPLRDFYEYFKTVNVSENEESFNIHESEYNADDSDQILNSEITETEILKAINAGQENLPVMTKY